MSEISHERDAPASQRHFVVVVHYHAPEHLERIVRQVQRLDPQAHSLIIADNSAALDHTVAQSWAPEIPTEVITLANPGYGAAVNAARRAITDPHLTRMLVLTHDADFAPETISLLDADLADPDVAIAAPIVNYQSRRNRRATAGGFVSHVGIPTHITTELRVTPYEVDWADGAMMLVSLAAFDDVGGFDERYHLYYEDVDLCARIRRTGRIVVVDPRAQAWEEPGNFTPYLRVRNHLLFVRGRYSILQIVGGTAEIVIRGCSRAVHEHSPIMVAWVLRGLLDGLRGRGGRPPPGPLARTRRS